MSDDRIEAPCDHDGGCCDWTDDDELFDDDGNIIDRYPAFCLKCYRTRDWWKAERRPTDAREVKP